jgi:hypothetical protein
VSRQQIIEREARQRPWVVVCCFLPVVLYIAAQVLESGIDRAGLDTELFRSIDEHGSAVVAAAVVRSLGLGLVAIPLAYLFKAAAARTDRVRTGFLALVVLGPVLLALQSLVGGIAERSVASDFVAQAAGVGDIYSLAANLREDSGTLQMAAGLLLPSVLALAFGMIYTGLWAVRVGLATRFFGTFGMALGASLLLLGGIALIGLMLWFVYLGMLLLGRAPAGRPPAWDAGEAIPWLPPGEEPVAAAAGPGADDVIEGDASEIPGVAENPNAARRDRAKRRKRKRRR